MYFKYELFQSAKMNVVYCKICFFCYYAHVILRWQIQL
uniref:Uncharacterized protein n=1 Tax=Anguilla anguilla TaxID=7936 RepID=A0A0E9X8V9_ANGAN